MAERLSAEQRTQYLEDLRGILNAARLADVRTAAKAWGWSLRGTAKAEVVEQMLAYMTDRERMLQAFKQLPADEQETLIWLQIMGSAKTEARLAIALDLAGGHHAREEDIPPILQRLYLRLLAFRDASGGWRVPAIFQEWLPKASAPGLAWTGQIRPVLAPRPEETIEEAGNLLAAIADERPRTGRTLPATSGIVRSWVPDFTPRPAPIAPEVLHTWGYTDADEQNRANFLVALLMAAHYCRRDDRNEHVEPTPQGLETWEAASLQARYQSLQTWWLTDGLKGSNTRMPWHELDLALGRIKDYRMPTNPAWSYGMESLEQDVGAMRQFVLATVQLLEPDQWYSLDAFGEFLYRTRRDLLALRPHYGMGPRWYLRQAVQDPDGMSLSTWRETYGVLLETLITGPAAWLYFVEIARDGSRIAAFRRPSQLEPRPASLPPDAVVYHGDKIVLRNVWQTALLREHVRRIAVTVSRTRNSTTYRLDARPFRDALRTGTTAAVVTEAFASAGFRLPGAIEARLADWQAKAGRYQIYDNVAVIEVGDDLALPEIQAATVLGRSSVYAAGPRCLVVLDPEIIPQVVEELRRKGYTPRVVTGP